MWGCPFVVRADLRRAPPGARRGPGARSGGALASGASLVAALGGSTLGGILCSALLFGAQPCRAFGATPAAARTTVAQSEKPTSAEDTLTRATQWFSAAKRAKRGLDGETMAELPRIVADLRILLASQPALRPPIAVALLDIASLAPRGPADGPRATTSEQQASELAFDALVRGLDLDESDEFAQLIGAQIGADDPARPLERRRAAIEALRGRRIEATLAALVRATESPERELRDAATLTLCGWDHPEAHRAMVTQWVLLRSDPRRSQARHVERHLASVRLPAGSPLERALFETLRPDFVSRDWRTTMRALRASDALHDARAVPTLIEGLALWIGRRRGAEGGSLRIEHEFVLALQRRSGKNIGAFPERWSRWWRNAHENGPASGPASGPADGPATPQQATRAMFYGLRPATDRVCFVLDRSGSMDSRRTNGEARYVQALGELERFLREMGPATRFRLVLFSTGIQVWRDDLTPATPAAIADALNWAGYRKPDGGTELRPAVEHVLRLGRDGRPDLAKLEEDTVIVLCDGATAEGSGWVEPLLERVGAEACLTFHCVMIGRGSGDGTLSALAERSGGDYVETDE
jgi:hypothetical protein